MVAAATATNMAAQVKPGAKLPATDPRPEIQWLLDIYWSNELQLSLIHIHTFGAPALVRDELQEFMRRMKENQRKLDRYIRIRFKEAK